MEKENKEMIQLSDEELLDMVGGFDTSSGLISAINPPVRLFYGIKGPIIVDPIRPLYGIEPPVRPLYGIEPTISLK
ncbi:hypothetical protein LY28_02839 [Ruminiclostridium sufflavum DSM 19573]|uniref:Uncharacterized protein n=1 Tax=Ruminiclostridium sufflavum DSM 19573 TaxID=1121337 RepID=A0A318XHF1_9FIRM|nr:hypothetical protein [Ruminiclostridium sufflavum]PYG86620.1 hypothetical protein LY28_02839 [Ruminiclostridium sufflavum DSM 19573]